MVQSVDLGREWNDPFTIVIVRSTLTQVGRAPEQDPKFGI